MKRPFLRAHLAVFAATIIYGANYVIAKSVMPEPIQPNAFIAMRALGAVLLFWVIAWRKITVPKRKDWGAFILCGLTGVAVNQLLFFNGLALTSPINSSIIMTCTPILVMLLAALLHRHLLTPRTVSGVLLGASGAIALILSSQTSQTSSGNALGDLLILINAISYAFYLVKVKSLMVNYHPLNVITWVFTIGLVAVLPFGGMGLSEVPWITLTAWQWFAVAFVILFVTFLTYLLNILALSVLSSATTSAYIYLQPLLAGIFAFLFSLWTGLNFEGEVTIWKLICTALIFAGVYLVSSGDFLKRNR